MADEFFEPDEPVEDVKAAFERAAHRGVTRVPTNAELAERAKDKELPEIVRGWLTRHVGVERPDGEWFDWAAQNFCADPEIRAWISIAVQRQYQRGYEDGRRAEGATDRG